MNRRLLALAAFLACCAPALWAARPSLTPADIEQATGLRGIHLVPETTKGAVAGRSNYADGNGMIVLWFHDFDAQGFARAKAQPARTMSGIEIEPKLFHTMVAESATKPSTALTASFSTHCTCGRGKMPSA